MKTKAILTGFAILTSGLFAFASVSLPLEGDDVNRALTELNKVLSNLAGASVEEVAQSINNILAAIDADDDISDNNKIILSGVFAALGAEALRGADGVEYVKALTPPEALGPTTFAALGLYYSADAPDTDFSDALEGDNQAAFNDPRSVLKNRILRSMVASYRETIQRHRTLDLGYRPIVISLIPLPPGALPPPVPPPYGAQ